MTRRATALVGSWLGLSLLALIIILDGSHMEPPALAVSDGLGYVGLVMLAWQFILNARTRTLGELFGAKTVHGLHRYGTCLALTLLALHPAILFVLDPGRYLRLLDLLIAPWRARAAVASAALLAGLVVFSWKRLRTKVNPKLWRSLHRTAGVVVVALGLVHIVLVGHYTAGWQGAALVTAVLGATLLPMVWVREPAKKPSKSPTALLPRLYFGLGLHRVRYAVVVVLLCAATSLVLAGRVMLTADLRPGTTEPRVANRVTAPSAPQSSMPDPPRAGSLGHGSGPSSGGTPSPGAPRGAGQPGTTSHRRQPEAPPPALPATTHSATRTAPASTTATSSDRSASVSGSTRDPGAAPTPEPVAAPTAGPTPAPSPSPKPSPSPSPGNASGSPTPSPSPSPSSSPSPSPSPSVTSSPKPT